mmetsp:Transcript_23760/g.31803  ORF Transcript_23760/g.31803 Transcript_23760/m.31803 type:complete len:248 (+) Transcript_23760:1641-2384(+)
MGEAAPVHHLCLARQTLHLLLISSLHFFLGFHKLLLEHSMALSLCPLAFKNHLASDLLSKLTHESRSVSIFKELLVVDIKDTLAAQIFIAVEPGDKLILTRRQRLTHELAEELSLVEALLTLLLSGLLLWCVDLAVVEGVRDLVEWVDTLCVGGKVLLEAGQLWLEQISIERGLRTGADGLCSTVPSACHLLVLHEDVIIALFVSSSCSLLRVNEVVECAAGLASGGEVVLFLETVNLRLVFLEPCT